VDILTFLAGLALGFLLLGAWAARHSVFRVEEGSVAVLSTFGAAECSDEHHKLLRTWGPGLHAKRPWQKVIAVQMMEQILDLSGDKARVAMAADGTTLRLDSILRYQPLEGRLADYLFGMKSPREHVTGLFTCLLRNEIANFGTNDGLEASGRSRALNLSIRGPGHVGIDDMGSFALLRSRRARLNQDIAEFCHTQMEDRYGIRFNAVDLVDILPPDELAVALNAVIYAHTEAGTLYYRMEGDCQQRILGAEQGLEIAKAKAKAIELEMLKLADFLGELDSNSTLDLYVRRRRAEVLGDTKLLYINEPNA
jgi:regulator of protease activity HflC (stomatin/prohibitin superfamily)